MNQTLPQDSVLPHLRIFTPHPNIIAFYDGRVPGYTFMDGKNWVDDGAIGLGVASYAIVDGAEALVYDTHVSVAHARAIRAHLEALGVKRIAVVLSHWHLDHIAGTEAFQDCEIIANSLTAAHLRDKHAALESGRLWGPPAIAPLIHPNRMFEHRMKVRIGHINVELLQLNIHSDDATVLWLPSERLLLAGDTIEDTVTYVVEAEHFDTHLRDLDKLWALDPARVLPNHGDPGIIAGGGYAKTIIRGMQQYIRFLKRVGSEPHLREQPLKDAIAGPLSSGWVTYHGGYEAVHKSNLDMVAKHFGATR